MKWYINEMELIANLKLVNVLEYVLQMKHYIKRQLDSSEV